MQRRASSRIVTGYGAITRKMPMKSSRWNGSSWSTAFFRASTSPAGATTISGTCLVVAPRMRAIAPETASPSATIRSYELMRSALTVSAAVSTDVVT